jgi:hypothetical protein
VREKLHKMRAPSMGGIAKCELNVLGAIFFFAYILDKQEF